MGILDTISEIISSLGTIGQVALIIGVIAFLIIYVVIPIALIGWNSRTEIVNEVQDITEAVKDVAPEVLEAAKTYCELDQTVLNQLRPNTIGSYMLNNVGERERMILENWKETGNITACEIKILDENIDDLYKERLNLKSVTKSLVGCNLIDCLEKYKIIEEQNSQE